MIKYVLSVGLILVSSVMLYANENPLDIIKAKDVELQKAISTYRVSSSVDNKKNIISLINGIFDFQIMGQKALPKSVWDSISADQKKTFVNQFQRMVETASFSKLEMYQSDSVSYTLVDGTSPEKIDISAQVWLKGRTTKLVYKMQKINGQWKVWDLLIGDMSTVRTYREQFTELLKTKTITELTALLQKKADSYSDEKK